MHGNRWSARKGLRLARAGQTLVGALALIAAFAAPASAQSREINLITPGVVFNSGLPEFAAAFTRQTGIKVNIKTDGMGRIVNDIKTASPAADVVFLPLNLMASLEQDKGVVAGTVAPVGRVNIGLAVKKGDPVPDISTVAKLAAVLKAAQSVVYSNPAGGSMEAQIIDAMLKRPEFDGVKKVISTRGEGGEALIRGEAQMALQLICEIVNHPELVNAGPVPEELGAYIDTATAVSARSTHAEDAKAFIKYITQPGTFPLWYSKGLIRKE